MASAVSIHHRLDRVARTARARPALRTPERTTTFGELVEGADRVAALLGELGCAPRDRVAILASEHASVVAAVLGALKAGCAFAPLEAAAHSERLARLLAALSCRAIVVDAASRARIPAAFAALPVVELDGAAPLRAPRSTVPIALEDPDAPSSIYFTSGSTGAPRAVVGRLSGIEHHIAWELAFLGADASVRGAIVHATSYDAYLPDVLVPLCAGGVACAPAAREVVADPPAFCAWLEREEITLLHCVPSLFRSLLSCPEASRLTALQHVLLAGEVVRPHDVRTARAVLGDRVRLVNLYGPTEATFVKTFHEITSADLDCDAVPIGRPMPGVTVHVLDDDGRPCRAGAIGQIAIQSPYGALGYDGDDALTRQRFRDAPDGSGQTMYLTGDDGRWHGDTLMFHGRRDRQIKLCGARVDLDEVEAIICACDGVLEAAVIVRDDAVLHGFVVLAPSAQLARVRAQVAPRLSTAMRLAWLTPLDALPRTASGKIDRARLAAPASGEGQGAAPAALA